VLGGVADQAVDRLDLVREVFVVRDLPAAVAASDGFTVVVVDIDQVDVAGDIQFARPQLAHADHPHPGAFPAGGLRRAVLGVEHGARLPHGHVEGQFRQFGHGAGHDFQRCLVFAGAVAIEHHQPFHHQLAQHPQRGAGFQPLRQQGIQGGLHACPNGCAGGQQRKPFGIAAAHALDKAGIT